MVGAEWWRLALWNACRAFLLVLSAFLGNPVFADQVGLFTVMPVEGQLDLWRSGGTEASTSRIATIAVNMNDGYRIWYEPYSFVDLGDGRAVFLTWRVNTGRADLWVTNGEADGTHLVRSINWRPGFGSFLTPLGDGRVVFSVLRSPVPGYIDLWVSDGTRAGTQVIDNNIASMCLVPLGHGVALFNDYQIDGDGGSFILLARTDGTRGGTRRLSAENMQLNPGTFYYPYFDGCGGWYPSYGSDANVMPFGRLGADRVVFFGTGRPSATDLVRPGLWVSNGTPRGTRLLMSFDNHLDNKAEFLSLENGTVVFSMTTAAHGREMWVTDGTRVGTRLLRDIAPGEASSNPFAPFQLEAGLGLFVASRDGGYYSGSLWATDGTRGGTRRFSAPRLNRIDGGFGIPQGWAQFEPGRAFFSLGGDSSEIGREPWVTDGTAVGTFMIRDINSDGNGPYRYSSMSGWPNESIGLNGQVLFAAYVGPSGEELWITDGYRRSDSPAGRRGTRLLMDIVPGPYGSAPRFLGLLEN